MPVARIVEITCGSPALAREIVQFRACENAVLDLTRRGNPAPLLPSLCPFAIEGIVHEPFDLDGLVATPQDAMLRDGAG